MPKVTSKSSPSVRSRTPAPPTPSSSFASSATPPPTRPSPPSPAASATETRALASPAGPPGSTRCAATSREEARMAMHSVELLPPGLPELIDALLRRNRWSWQALERGDLKLGDEALDIDRLQWWLINADPVLWVETNLVNKPEDGGGLWKLFPYQRPSIRFRGHVVHQDGAEVGKSREIVGLLLWGCLAAERGSALVGSALDGDLDEIWEEVEWQLSANPYLADALRNRTTKPYRRLTWRNGLRMLFRPAGHDGRAYRGIHVRRLLLPDEAAQLVNPRSWSEFWRAAKPGAGLRFDSVQAGERHAR